MADRRGYGRLSSQGIVQILVRILNCALLTLSRAPTPDRGSLDTAEANRRHTSAREVRRDGENKKDRPGVNGGSSDSTDIRNCSPCQRIYNICSLQSLLAIVPHPYQCHQERNGSKSF